MKNDTLKKHHFWFLLGAVPLFTLIAVLIVSSKVGGKIEARNKLIEDEKKKIDSKSNPKPNSRLAEATVSLGKVGTRQNDLWKENWDKQKYLFMWPSSSRLLSEFSQMDLKFGGLRFQPIRASSGSSARTRCT